MVHSSEILFTATCLCEAAGLQRPPHTVVGLDWNRWLQVLEENQLAPFLAGRTSPAWNVPDWVRKELAAQYARAGSAAMPQLVEFLRVLRALEGVAETVVLKGAALVPLLYREAAERTMWDVDLLFASAEDQQKANGLLQAAGYRPRKRLASHHHLPALENPVNNMVFELHTNLVTPPLPPDFIAEIWQRRRRIETEGGPSYQVLDGPSLLAHQCIHALTNPIESPLLRNLFEVAWLVSRMGPSERDAFRDLARRWNIDTFVARALWLASDLFDSPPLFERPRRTAWELWSEARLEWCQYKSFWSRWLRHVSLKHIEQLLEGAGERSVVPFLGVAGRSVWHAVASRVIPRLPRGGPPRRPACLRGAPLGETLLLYDASSGETHLLNPLAARVWDAADGTLRAGDIADRLREHGIPPSDARRAIRGLVAKGILDQ